MTPESSIKVKKQIKGEIYDALREGLVKVDGRNKKSWAEVFIQKVLEEAKKDPKGPLGQMIAKQIMQDDIISSLDAETEKLLSRDRDFLHYRLIKQLYDKQREVAYDTKFSRKVIVCSRRAGKTELAARLLVDYCIDPETPVLYIHTKADNAFQQCWPLVLKAAKEIELAIEKADASNMYITFTNGSSIKLASNKDKSSAALLRGGKYKLIIIDEAQSQRNMKELVEDVCEPMLVDYKDSCLILQGTPPRIPKTYMQQAWEAKGWHKYHFTMCDNPFLPGDPEEYIKSVAEKKGLTLDSPLIQREYQGLFVFDTEAQVYKDYKVYKDIPDSFIPTDVAIGVDYGFQDYNGIAPLVYNRNTKQGYVIHCRKFNKSTVSEIITTCRQIYEEMKLFCIQRNPNMDMSKIAFYCDTSDQSISYEMSTNYKLPVYNCYKHDKKLAIAQLSEWCRTARIQIEDGSDLEDEFTRIVYKRDEDDNITSEIDDDIFHPDLADALLYASRQYAYDCGDDLGGESSDKKAQEQRVRETLRQSTLPPWIQNSEENNEDFYEGDYGYDD